MLAAMKLLISDVDWQVVVWYTAEEMPAWRPKGSAGLDGWWVGCWWRRVVLQWLV